jgi:hypothetical protein
MKNDASLTAEGIRLFEDRTRLKNWKRWGPYLSERQWATVREDYSPYGTCWDYFPHDHARSRVYRWGEDGLLGFTDRECRLCFALVRIADAMNNLGGTGLWDATDGFYYDQLKLNGQIIPLRSRSLVGLLLALVCFFATLLMVAKDAVRFGRWRQEYESSIGRVIRSRRKGK